MMYPYVTFNDDTEITHSEMYCDGSVKVCIETPTDNGFKSAECWLPMNRWEIHGYTYLEMQYLRWFIRKNADLIMEFSQDGGILGAGNL